MVCLNPNGLRIYSYPFETLRSQAMMQYIQEWHSPDFQSPLFLAFAVLLLATFAALALSGKRPRPGHLIMLLATAWAGLRSARNVPFFALVASPLFAEHLWSWLSGQSWARWLSKPDGSESENLSGGKIILNALLCGIILAVSILGVAHAVIEQRGSEAQRFPVGAVDFILASGPPQPIFNEYSWGGYLIWRLYPTYLVHIDGRADVYGDKLVQEWVESNDGNTNWHQHLERYGIRTVLIKPSAALTSLLRQDARWHKVFEDKQAVIFVRR
jgi:hypothetical protein